MFADSPSAQATLLVSEGNPCSVLLWCFPKEDSEMNSLLRHLAQKVLRFAFATSH